MESVSPSENPPEPPSSRFSHLVGAVVAVLTLMLPVLAIAHYSSANAPPATLPGYPFSQTRE